MKYPRISGQKLGKPQRLLFDRYKKSISDSLWMENDIKFIRFTKAQVDILSHNIATNLMGDIV